MGNHHRHTVSWLHPSALKIVRRCLEHLWWTDLQAVVPSQGTASSHSELLGEGPQFLLLRGDHQVHVGTREVLVMAELNGGRTKYRERRVVAGNVPAHAFEKPIQQTACDGIPIRCWRLPFHVCPSPPFRFSQTIAWRTSRSSTPPSLARWRARSHHFRRSLRRRLTRTRAVMRARR